MERSKHILEGLGNQYYRATLKSMGFTTDDLKRPVIGMYDGLIGPGTGTFLIMAFTLVLGMDLLTASGCAKVGNLASNVASAVVWSLGGKVLWTLVPPAALCSILGNWCGARYAIRGGSGRVRGMIFVVLGLLFCKLGYELFF